MKPLVESLEELPLFLTPGEVQQLLRIGRNQVYDAIRNGELPAVRRGRSLRIPRDVLQKGLPAADCIAEEKPATSFPLLKDAAPPDRAERGQSQGPSKNCTQSSLAAHQENLPDDEEALHLVVSWCRANQDRFWGRESDDLPAGTELLGQWDREPAHSPQRRPIGIYPHLLRQQLEGFGFVPTVVLKAWKERGWLDCDHCGNGLTKQVKVIFRHHALIVIKESAIEEIEGRHSQ